MSADRNPTLAIPQAASERLLRNLGAFVAGVDQGLTSGAADPRQTPRWKRASGLLHRDLNVATLAAEHARSGGSERLVAVASKLRFLAKRMDGYRLDFAGPDLGERLETDCRLTVLVAWQIFAAGTGSKASGL